MWFKLKLLLPFHFEALSPFNFCSSVSGILHNYSHRSFTIFFLLNKEKNQKKRCHALKTSDDYSCLCSTSYGEQLHSVFGKLQKIGFHLVWDLAQLQKIKRFFIFVFMLLTVKILSKQKCASVPASEFLSWLLRLFFRHYIHPIS